MKNFYYEVIKYNGRMQFGHMNAETENEVETALKQQGFFVADIREVIPVPPPPPKKTWFQRVVAWLKDEK